MFRYLIPLAVFLVLVGFFLAGLQRDPTRVPSPLIDKPLPEFSLPQLRAPDNLVHSDDIKGEVTLINVWASWCVPCRYEHPILMQLAREQQVQIIGVNYKDARPDALQWLERYGDPYSVSLFDASGQTGIDLGVYGVPETYIVDAQGVIRYKHIGPVDEAQLSETILPIIKRLRRGS